MLLKLQTLNLFTYSIRRNSPNLSTLQYLLLENLCTFVQKPESDESPEVPNWVKILDKSKNTESSSPSNDVDHDDDNDFVIPSLASWVESYGRFSHIKTATDVESDSRENDVDLISKILKNSRYGSPDDVVKSLNSCTVDVSDSVVEQILKRFSNDWIPAFGFFTWAKSQTSHVYSPVVFNSMVDVLGKSKKFHFMWDLVEEMKGLGGYVTLVTMSKVIRRLARAGRYVDAFEAFLRMEEYGVDKDTDAMNVLMDALVKEGTIEQAQNVFLQLKDRISVDLRTYNILIHGYSKCRKFDEARKIMGEMCRHGFEPDVVSYTSLIEAYCHEMDFRNVDVVFEEMKEKGCRPNSVSYTIYMHALGKAKQINDAIEVYNHMKNDGCIPDSSFYSSLIYILSKAGRFKYAWDIFEDMENQKVRPDLLTYNTIIAASCERSQEDSALSLLKKMEDDSCKPDLKTYAPLLKMCCRMKRMKILQFLLSHMFKNNVSMDLSTYCLLVLGLSKSGLLDQACLYFEEMVVKGMIPHENVYKMLVRKLVSMSMSKEKEHIEKLMVGARKQVGNLNCG